MLGGRDVDGKKAGEIGMLALGRMMSGRGTESCTMHQGRGSRVHGQMMPSTVLGYVTLLTGVGWRVEWREGKAHGRCTTYYADDAI